jgi:hypothetical protein
MEVSVMQIKHNDLPTMKASSEIEDNGNVRVGGLSPSLPPVKVPPTKIRDTGKVRVGGLSPNLPPVKPIPMPIQDSGKVRIGGLSSF